MRSTVSGMSLPLPETDDVTALRARLRGHLDPPVLRRPAEPTEPDDEPWDAGPVRWEVSGRAAAAVAVALILVIAVLGVLLWRGGPGDVVVLPEAEPAIGAGLATGASAPAGAASGTAASTPGAPATADATDAAAAPGAATLLVHVVGQVREPGVVQLPPGSRVGDAIQAAGGAKGKADLSALNLAAPVTDGEQVRVPKLGETVVGGSAPASGAPASGPSAGGTGGAAAGAPSTVDLNTADVATLETLPGVGPVLAGRIVSHREQHGPFASVDALQDVSGIGPATFARLRDLVRAG